MQHAVKRISRTLALFAVVFLAVTGLMAIFPTKQLGNALTQTGSRVVKLTPPSRNNTGGTGFAVQAPSGQNYVLTNAHVCQLAENNYMSAHLPFMARQCLVRVLEISPETDLCLLTAIPNLRGLPLAAGNEVGDEVTLVGHPLLDPLTLTKGVVTNFDNIQVVHAINSSKEECDKRHGAFEEHEGDILGLLFGIRNLCIVTVFSGRITAATFPGNSGSPVVDNAGNVVGVLFAGDNRTNFGFMVPLKDVLKFLSVY
jgi:S1-C subfamily serine protease